jgi:aminoglycoside 3-N-acetyltransferase I
MSSSAPFSIRLLTPADVVLMDAMLTTFGEVETYSGARRSRAYLARLLGSDCFIALAALKGAWLWAASEHSSGRLARFTFF